MKLQTNTLRGSISMGRKGAVLEFRRPKARKILAPGPVRTNKLKFSGGKRSRRARGVFRVRSLLVALTVVPAIFLAGMLSSERLAPGSRDSPAEPFMAGSSSGPAATLVSVNWVDGDSGTLDGRRFRLYGVDAPESSAAHAGCASEMRRADAARDAVRALTRGGTVAVSRTHGIDKYDRELVSLEVGGRDVASTLIASGHLKRWNYERGDRKPDWCGS